MSYPPEAINPPSDLRHDVDGGEPVELMLALLRAP
jgi:hypothetical protein